MSTIAFKDLKGKGSKSGPERMKFQEGKNAFRIVSAVIPGYKYWVKTRDDQSVPMDNLSFNRETEQFDNTQKDWVKEYFPDLRSNWAYCCLVIDRADNKLKLLDLKKKLLGDIIEAANQKLGDPSDPKEGWDVICSRIKTGPKVFNVEYRLEHFQLENSPLSEEDQELISEGPNIEDIIRNDTPEDQLRFLKEFILPEEVDDEEALKEVADEPVGASDDLS
jgi:hypothetical protein